MFTIPRVPGWILTSNESLILFYSLNYLDCQGSKIGKPDSLGRVEIIVGHICLRTNKPDGACLLF